jgi:hypothetical protein
MRVIVTGGVDTDTGYAFTGMLTARADGSRAASSCRPSPASWMPWWPRA